MSGKTTVYMSNAYYRAAWRECKCRRFAQRGCDVPESSNETKKASSAMRPWPVGRAPPDPRGPSIFRQRCGSHFRRNRRHSSEVPENQVLGFLGAPILDPSLQRSQLRLVRVRVGHNLRETVHQFLAGRGRFIVQPVLDGRPGVRERVGAFSTTARRPAAFGASDAPPHPSMLLPGFRGTLTCLW